MSRMLMHPSVRKPPSVHFVDIRNEVLQQPASVSVQKYLEYVPKMRFPANLRESALRTETGRPLVVFCRRFIPVQERFGLSLPFDYFSSAFPRLSSGLTGHLDPFTSQSLVCTDEHNESPCH